MHHRATPTKEVHSAPLHAPYVSGAGRGRCAAWRRALRCGRRAMRSPTRCAMAMRAFMTAIQRSATARSPRFMARLTCLSAPYASTRASVIPGLPCDPDMRSPWDRPAPSVMLQLSPPCEGAGRVRSAVGSASADLAISGCASSRAPYRPFFPAGPTQRSSRAHQAVSRQGPWLHVPPPVPRAGFHNRTTLDPPVS